MHGWPNWMYFLWSLFIRAVLFPVVLPVRLYDKVRGKEIAKELTTIPTVGSASVVDKAKKSACSIN